jgi:hypothetical protein
VTVTFVHFLLTARCVSSKFNRKSIVENRDPRHVSPKVRASAAVYLRQKILTHWSKLDAQKAFQSKLLEAVINESSYVATCARDFRFSSIITGRTYENQLLRRLLLLQRSRYPTIAGQS